MAPINPPQYLQAGSYTARSDRLMVAAMLTPQHGTSALAVRGGVRPSPGGAALTVTQQVTPVMSVTVAAGTVFIQSPSASGGCYVCVNDAAYTVSVTTAHASLGRRDLIVARIFDAEISGAVNQWTLEVVTGTPAASPVVPAVPSGAISLATIVVNGAQSSITNANITDTRTFTTALGGTTPAPAASMPATPYTGMAAYDTTNLRPVWHNGTAWQGWAEDPLMSQMIIRCTSSTRPGSPVEGMHIYETNTQRLMYYRSGAWVPATTGTQPLAVLRQTVQQTLAGGGAWAISFQQEDLDNYNGHVTSGFDSRYVAQVAGWYRIHGVVGIFGQGTAELRLVVNGLPYMTAFSSSGTVSGTDRRYNATWMANVALGQWFEIQVYVFESTNTLTANSVTSMYVEWVGP